MKLTTVFFTGLAAYVGARALFSEPRKAKRRRSLAVPGVYQLVGQNNCVRYGQAEDIEQRARVSARSNEACLGPAPEIRIVRREPNRARRLRLEKRLIQRHRERAPEQVCNRVDW